jgi:hypothetical protein
VFKVKGLGFRVYGVKGSGFEVLDKSLGFRD